MPSRTHVQPNTCPTEHIAAASKADRSPLPTVDRPAAELYAHYDGLCKNVTQDFYRNALGRLVDPADLKPVESHMHEYARQ